jgi:hypothetical protein
MPTKEKTLAYWARLNEIAIAEAGLQRDAEVAFNAGNASKVFAIKGRVSRFSANAVEAVPTEAVDEAALQFGRQLKLWYDRAGELYERAVRIWETPIGQQARTQLTERGARVDEPNLRRRVFRVRQAGPAACEHGFCQYRFYRQGWLTGRRGSLAGRK